MNHNLLHIDGKAYVLVPIHDYHAMKNGGRTASDDLPEEIRNALVEGRDHPVKILRRHRGMRQTDLAEAAGISRPYLAEIERGHKPGSVQALRHIAAVLGVDIGMLIVDETD